MSARAWKRRRNKAVVRWLNDCAARIAAEDPAIPPFRLSTKNGLHSDLHGNREVSVKNA